MDSSVTAPWARTPRRLALHNPDSEEDHPLSGALLGHTNEPLLGQVGDVVFDNEGYCGRGIEYGRADMDAMEGVDYIRMAEWGRECKGVWRSYHIVSQRFRKWAHDFGCRFRMSGIPLVE